MEDRLNPIRWPSLLYQKEKGSNAKKKPHILNSVKGKFVGLHQGAQQILPASTLAASKVGQIFKGEDERIQQVVNTGMYSQKMIHVLVKKQVDWLKNVDWMRNQEKTTTSFRLLFNTAVI